METTSLPSYTVFDGGAAGRAYNEVAFRHFLAIERRRAERAAQSLSLVLVSMRVTSGRRAVMDPATAAAVFAALGQSVREVDFVGWYRDGQIAAALLTHDQAHEAEIGPRLTGRVIGALGAQSMGGPIPFRVLVVRLRGKTVA